MKNIVKKLAIFLIRTYQLTLSPRFFARRLPLYPYLQPVCTGGH